jgi:NDP-sugar pyrophosphorylase family protein
LGTGGSLTLLKGKINQTFFVNNCDILINQDYSEILNFHIKNKHEITIVAALKHYAIPYGTIETGNNGHLIELTEKPELTFKINSGMYVLEPHLLDEIPENKFFHITQLIESVKHRKGKIGVFPVSEKSWVDIGEAHLLKQYYHV